METLRYVLLTNGLLAVVTIAFYVLLRRETFFGANRLALWLGLMASLVLPLLRIPDWRPQPVRAVMQRTAQVIVPRVLPNQSTTQPEVTITFQNGRTYPMLAAKPTTRFVWTWQKGLITLYGVGVLLLLIRLGLQLMSLRKLIRRSEHDAYSDFTLVRNEHVQSPFSFFGWVVLNPAAHAPDELEQILRHERVHVRERHSLDMLGAELVCIGFWFNPAAYLFRHLLHQTLEFAADRAVLAEGVDARAYQYNLVKVSLSAGQSNLTNSFSKSFLKPRIVMINQPNSTRATWLKYPVLLLATLTVATLFARPKAQRMVGFISKPAAHIGATVIRTKPAKSQPTFAGTTSFTDSVETGIIPLGRRVNDATVVTDSVRKPAPSPNRVRINPSRYMQYEGDRLYWIITPKTSFGDLAIMKQEFERHGYKMKIQRLAYDPLDQYITDIKVAIVGPVVGVNDFEKIGVDGSPIRSHGGYNGLRDINNEAAIGVKLPPELLQTLRDEEASVATFIRTNRSKYLMTAGQKLSTQYGTCSNVTNVDGLLARPDITQKYGITLSADGTLAVADTRLPLFIDNKPVTNEILKRINVKMFNWVMLSEVCGQNRQPGVVKALLFYTNEP